MKTGFLLLTVAVLVVLCEARLAEKVSEDDDFVVYRIPVKALDLQSQATAQFEGYELPAHYGRSSSKSSSHSKSTSQSTGSGKGKGYGEGGSSQGYGQGHGGSSSGHGYGGSSGGHGYGQGGSGGGSGYGGSGSGYGGSGSGYGGSGSGYGGGGSGTGYGGSGTGYGGSGTGHGGSGSGYGSQYRGSRQQPRTGYFSSHFDGFQSDYMSSPYKYGGGPSSGYGPSYEGGSGGSNTQHYDDEEGDHPKIVTTTKSITTNSAHDTGLGQHQYRQPGDSLGDIRFKLGDYLKDAPGHEISKYGSQKFREGAAAAADLNPGYRTGQAFNVNEFTRTLNQGVGVAAFNAPAYRNNRFVPQASFPIPRAYAFRHSGFGLPVF